MSDSAFKAGNYPGYTLAQLQRTVADGQHATPMMLDEIKRRLAVAQGDVSQMTPTERIAHNILTANNFKLLNVGS
jgi:hypothetical protein